MMMQMLRAGGLEVLTDGERAADEDNLRGYLELERVKQLPEDNGWVLEAKGKVIKVISQLLRHLPEDLTYRVLFMERDLDEVLASQRQMLVRRGRIADAQADDSDLARAYAAHLKDTKAWLAGLGHMEVLYVAYRDIVHAPAESAGAVAAFLGGRVDASRMAAVVDPALYRQKA